MRSHIEIDIAAQPCQFSSQPTRKSVAAQAMSDFHDDMPWSYLNGGHEPPFFSGEDHRKKNKKNTCRQGYRVFSNPFIMENDGWVTLQLNPVDLCRWKKKTHRLNPRFAEHHQSATRGPLGPVAKVPPKVASRWDGGVVGRLFFFFLVRTFWTKNEGLEKKRLKNCT